VTVVDNNPDLVRRAMDTLDVQGMTGFASYPDVLDRAGARDADMMVAATHSDEVNMVTCQVAHSVFNRPRKIARLRSAKLSRRDLFRSLPPRSPADRRGDQPRARGGGGRAAAARRAPSAFDTETVLTAARSCWGSSSTRTARW
jgi:trk system potassium uptake protein TrkA